MLHREKYGLIFFVVIAAAALAACGGGGSDERPTPAKTITFAHDGLSGLAVNNLYQRDNQLFAATSDGVFIKSTPQGKWQAWGLQGQGVSDIAILSSRHLLATVQSKGATASKLMETTSGRADWYNLEASFNNGTESVNWSGLIYDDNHNTLYGIGDNLPVTSIDSGRDWASLTPPPEIFSSRNDFVKHNALTHDLWFGGKSAQNKPVVRIYSNDLNQEVAFQELDINTGTLHDLIFDPVIVGRTIMASDNGLWRTTDNGQHWTLLLAATDKRSYRVAVHDPRNPAWIYTGRHYENANAASTLIFEWSQNRGDSWVQYHYPSNSLFGGVLSMLAVEENQTTVIYLGLDRGGVMKVVMPVQ